MNIKDFSKLSQWNRADIQDDTPCGCYFCLRICKGSEIDEWIDAETTALCPHCGIDAIVANVTDEAILAEALEEFFTGKVEKEELPYAEDYHPEIKISFDEKYSQEYIAMLCRREGPLSAEVLWSGYASGYLAALEHKKGE